MVNEPFDINGIRFVPIPELHACFGVDRSGSVPELVFIRIAEDGSLEYPRADGPFYAYLTTIDHDFSVNRLPKINAALGTNFTLDDFNLI
jgi:hypothetical protein